MLDNEKAYDNFIDEQIDKNNNAVIEERIDYLNRIEFLESELKISTTNRNFWKNECESAWLKQKELGKQIDDIKTRPIINLGDEKIADILKIISVELLAKLGIEIAEKDREIEELQRYKIEYHKLILPKGEMILDKGVVYCGLDYEAQQKEKEPVPNMPGWVYVSRRSTK
jgi:hypothetical protein